FNENDTLYILGDLADRGNDGIKIFLDVMNRPNVISLIGNHDWVLSVLVGRYDTLVKKVGIEEVENMFQLWYLDGGEPTYNAIKELSTEQKNKIIQYIKDMHYILEIEVNAKKYFLSHTIPAFDDIPLLDHPADDFIRGKPDYDKRYFEDKTIITGHTPTGLIDRWASGKIWFGNGHIAIDCGAGSDGPLGCLCLDDMKEYYIEDGQ
ncbi:MAG: metallophosphoesterase, partial [Clostridia bacterium]|nr:metallophosphoesterase [Clostridia bacterium]